MAGIAMALDLLRKTPTSYNTLHSCAFISATAAASAAAGTPYAYKALFGNFRIPIVQCDAAGALGSDDYATSFKSVSEKLFQNDALKCSSTNKEYKIELKPLFSAFKFRPIAVIILRSFLIFYSQLEPRTDDDDEDEQPVDYVAALKKTVIHFCRETAIASTRPILERVAVHHVSKRMTWKLLKDVPKSATRKASRGMSAYVFFFRVGKTTFRGHLLGIATLWSVQVGSAFYGFIIRLLNSKEEEGQGDEVKLLRKKVSCVTIILGSSLIFASIGAGIGAVLIDPSVGQSIGCWVGDFVGPAIVYIFVKKMFSIEIL